MSTINEANKLDYYKYFFEHSNDFTCIANTEGYFELLSPNFSSAFGYQNTELLKKKFIEFVHPEDINDTIHEIEKLKKGYLTTNFVNRYQKKDGSFLWLEWNASPDNSTGKIYAIARDVSNRKKNEDIIKKQVNEIAQANNELEQFLYVVTHNLQEPLKNINEAAEKIRTNPTTRKEQDIEEKIKYIIVASNNTKVYTNKLLLLSRIGKNKNFSKIDIAIVIEKIKLEFAKEITEHQAKITFSALPSIDGNSFEIEELIKNLLYYLIVEHSKNITPVIHVSSIEKEWEYLFEIKTNAIEIENKFEKSVFLILSSININQEHFDSDLSYLICKKITDAHNGKIWIESKLDSGSKIYFTITKPLKIT